MRVIMFVIITSVLAVGAVGAYALTREDGPNPFAESCSTTSDKITSPGNCAGGPDQNYVEIGKGNRNHFLLLDLGEGQEGTGDLLIYYKIESDVDIIVEFSKVENDTIVPIEEHVVRLSQDHTDHLVNYENSPIPYRYVRLYASEERKYKLDAIRTETYGPDSDRDDLPDTFEYAYGLNPLVATGQDGPNGDPDNDGVTNKEEYTNEISPIDPDTDDDDLPENWELDHGVKANNAEGKNGRDGDPDEDGLTNYQEYQWSTHPQKTDTDKDKLSDTEELVVYKTKPTKEDSDEDEMTDGWEVRSGLDPNSPSGDSGKGGDPDQDGVVNLDEFKAQSNARKSDSDDDCRNDLDEITQGTDPTNWGDGDCDGDGLSNGDEKNGFKTDPYQSDSDGDLLTDTWELQNQLNPLLVTGDEGRDGDPDKDGADNISEMLFSSNPHEVDSDDDTLPDIWEILHCLNPTIAEGKDGPDGDPDGDGWINFVELGLGTDPTGCHP